MINFLILAGLLVAGALAWRIAVAIRDWRQDREDARQARRLPIETVQHEQEMERKRLQMEQRQQEHQHHIELTNLAMQHYLLQTRLPYDANGNAPILLNHQDYHIMALPSGNPSYRPAAAQLKAGSETPTPAGIVIPGRYDMREVWHSGFRPSTKQIWLAKGASDDIIVPANKLLHSIATGPTGGGKTNIVRMILMQVVYIGGEVTLMDIHYAPIKEDEDGNPIDWRPIVNHLAQPPIYSLKAIIQWMKWLAYTELESRITRQRAGQPIGCPIFFTIAELPAVLDEAEDEIADPLAKILRQGRQYQIFFVGDSQDLLTRTLHMTTGPREAFRTGFYTGGDPTTAKALLDLPNGVKIDEEGLGQHGLVYVKTAIHPYTQARVGWASNESLYDLFETPVHERLGHPDRSYSQTFARRPETPPVEQAEDTFAERPNVQIVEADMPEVEPLRERPSNVWTSSQSAVNQPVETAHMTSDERPNVQKKYLLSDDEIDRFKAAYKACLNIDKALAAIGKGSNYRESARRVVQVYGLRDDA